MEAALREAVQTGAGSPRPFTIPTWLLSEMASEAKGSNYGMRMAEDLAVLGLGELAGRHMATWDSYMPTVDRILTDRSAAFSDRVRRRVEELPNANQDMTDLKVDAVTARLLETHGNSIAGLVMMTRLSVDVVLQHGTEDDGSGMAVDVVSDDRLGGANILLVSIPLGGDLTWEIGRILGANGIPESARQCARGAPLTRYVGHPLLDGLPLLVEDIDDDVITLMNRDLLRDAWECADDRPPAR